MSLNIVPKKHFEPESNPTSQAKILVMGVGGGGSNALLSMLNDNLNGVKFCAANTDAQALSASLIPHKIQLGRESTQGLGAGAKPEVGAHAAEESLDEINDMLEGNNLVFIVAGMGGGTGTGAAHVIAREAKKKGILVIGVVTKPFGFEGTPRGRVAEKGIEILAEHTDALIVIANHHIFRVANEKTTLTEAFERVDRVLKDAVSSVSRLIQDISIINVDFADIANILSDKSGYAVIGTGEAEGEDRAIEAAQKAIFNPLLEHTSMKGAKAVLIHVSGGLDMTIYHVEEATNHIKEEAAPGANIIFGASLNQELNGKMKVSLIATGVEPYNSSLNGAKASSGLGNSKTMASLVDIINGNSANEEDATAHKHGEAVNDKTNRNVNPFLSQEKNNPESKEELFLNELEKNGVHSKVSFIPPKNEENAGFDYNINDFKNSTTSTSASSASGFHDGEVRYGGSNSDAHSHAGNSEQQSTQVKRGFFSRLGDKLGFIRSSSNNNPNKTQENNDILSVPAYIRKRDGK